MSSAKPVRALFSVSDKSGVPEFAAFLAARGVEIISTGGTAKAIRAAGVAVQDISDITNFPEMLGGRVKTLHPAVHGGILFVRGDSAHERAIAEHEIGPIDIVCVNLYPFAQTIASGASEAEIIENIDIGGPSMIRSAAKNFESVTVLTEAEDIPLVQQEIEEHGTTTPQTRRMLAGKAFARTARFDANVAAFFRPAERPHFFQNIKTLRYGENPASSGELWATEGGAAGADLCRAKVAGDKEMGYCNYLDSDAAVRTALEFHDCACVIVKHATPCGAAVGSNPLDAFMAAREADPTSAFGGVIAINRPLDKATAAEIAKNFFEIICAPEIPPEVADFLAEACPNLRRVELPSWHAPGKQGRIREILGGALWNGPPSVAAEWTTVCGTLTEADMQDAKFGWSVCRHVASNAIVLASDGATVGIGGGQTSRVLATEIALKNADKRARGAVCASDAFFPFPDAVELLAEAGVRVIVQPGGSKNDALVQAAAEKAGIAMVHTGERVFRH